MNRRPFLDSRRREMLRWPSLGFPAIGGVLCFLLTWPILNAFSIREAWLKGESQRSSIPWAAVCGGSAFVILALVWLVEFLFGPRPPGGFDLFYLRRFPRYGRWVKLLAWLGAAALFVHMALTPPPPESHAPRVGRCIVGSALTLVAIVMIVVEFRRRP